jgi:hypothetical protein
LERKERRLKALFLFMFLFALCNSTFQLNMKKKMEKFFLISAFLFAIFSNVLWVILIPNPSIGASGLLYAVEGVLLGFSLVNGLQILNLSKFKTQRISTITIILVNFFVSVSIVTQIMLTPEIFLSVGPGVNVIAHDVSFLLGFCASVPWYYLIGKLSILD